MKVFIALMLTLAFFSAEALTVYRFTTASGLSDYDTVVGDSVEKVGAGCPSGSCIRIGNTRTENSYIIGNFSTAGASDCVIKFYVHTSSLESGDSCKFWTSVEGQQWVNYWVHNGPSEITGWDLITLDSSYFNGFSDGALKYGPDPTSGKKDYCWIDATEVTCQV